MVFKRNIEFDIRSAIEARNREPIENIDPSIPLSTLELLALFGVERIPKTAPFENTSLDGCQGKSILELSQTELEKILLWAAGFTRNIRYAATHMLEVPKEYSTSILKRKVVVLVNSFFDNDCNVGIRVHRGNANGTTSKPFCWISLNENGYLTELENNFLSLRLITGEQYTLEPGDLLQIFSSPASIEKDMVVKLSEEQEDGTKKIVEKNKKIKLGGGFVCRLAEYNSIDEVFSLDFYFIANDGNPRNIGEKPEDYDDQEFPEEVVRINVEVKDGKFELSEGVSDKNLRDIVDSGDMEKVLIRTAKNIVLNESTALCTLFLRSLNIYPKLDFHAVKGFYAIEDGENGEDLDSSSMTFDTEQLAQGESWLANSDHDIDKTPIASIRNPTPFLELIYEKLDAIERKIDGSERILIAQLSLNKEIRKFFGPNPHVVIAEIKNYLNENMDNFRNYALSTYIKKVLPILAEELSFFEADAFLKGVDRQEAEDVVRITRKETNKIIQSTVGKRYTSYSAESLFGKLMWEAVVRSEFRKVESTVKAKGYDNIYEYKHEVEGVNSTVVILDQGDFKIGFLVIDGEVIDLEEALNAERTKSIKQGAESLKLNVDNRTDRLEATRRVISKKLGLSGKIPKAAMRRDLGSD